MGLIILFATFYLPFATKNVKSQAIPTPREETFIVVSWADDYATYSKMNPFVPGGLPLWEVWLPALYEPLIWLDPYVGDEKPWLATDWEYNENYTSLTLHIRKGVTWSDGEPFTARDVAFSIELALENEAHPGHLWTTTRVESVETPDDYTVVIKFKKPLPRFHYAFRNYVQGSLWIVPEHVWKDQNITTFNNFPPVTAGPYKLVQAIPELKMWILERREDYWAKDIGFFPKPKYLIVRAKMAKEVEYYNWIHGAADWFHTGTIGAEALQTGATYPNCLIIPSPSTCIVAIYFNVDKYPTNITDFRRAIAYAIDREKVAKAWPYALLKPPVTDTLWPVWPGLEKWTSIASEIAKIEYNPDEAKSILDNLGFVDRDGDGIRETPDGTPLSFTMHQWTMERLPAHQSIVSDLKKVGIDVTIKMVPWPMFTEIISTGDYRLGGMPNFCPGMTTNNDPLLLFEQFHSRYYKPVGEYGPPTRWYNPELDEIIDNLTTIHPQDPRVEDLFRRGYKILMDELPVLPLISMDEEVYVSTKYWTGFPTADNLYAFSRVDTPGFRTILCTIEPTTKPAPTPTPVTYVTVYAKTDIPAFTGVDGESYGPYVAGDVMVIPKEDADKLISEGKATYSPPVPAEIPEIASSVSDLLGKVSELESTLTEISSTLSDLENSISKINDSINALSSQMATITTTVIGMNIAVIVLVIVGIVVAIRKK